MENGQTSSSSVGAGAEPRVGENGYVEGGSMSNNTAEFDEAFQSLFSLRKPKDFKAGCASGIKSIGKGVLGGVAGLVAAPVVGAVQEGAVGFAKGVGVGVAGAVILPVTGVGVGVAQMVRGAINTPEAIKNQKDGKYWDNDRHMWVDEPTTALVIDDKDLMQQRFQYRQREHLSALAEGNDYYEMLQVPRDAGPELIRKQYYLLAKKYHPDKAPNDPVAKERFQKLGEAYQVLANPDLRARYDRMGKDGLDVNLMDGADFFSMLFGDDRFDDLIGELMITTAARLNGEVTASQLDQFQRVRVSKVSEGLLRFLHAYEEGEWEGFQAMMEAKADWWIQASYGDVILEAVGKIYQLQAQIYKGEGFKGFFEGVDARFRQQGQTLKSQLNAASKAMKVFQVQRELEKRAMARSAQNLQEEGSSEQQQYQNQQEELEENLAQELEEKGLPVMLEAMWAANVVDIENTIRSACYKIFKQDAKDTTQVRIRAKGLFEISKIFLRKATEKRQQQLVNGGTSGVQDAREQMEEAMRKVLERRNQADQEAAPQ